jgi:hypothetical protein
MDQCHQLFLSAQNAHERADDGLAAVGEKRPAARGAQCRIDTPIARR